MTAIHGASSASRASAGKPRRAGAGSKPKKSRGTSMTRAAIRALSRPYLFADYEGTVLAAKDDAGRTVAISAAAALDCLVVAKRMNASAVLPIVSSTWLAAFAAGRSGSMDGMQMTRYCVSSSFREEEAGEGRSGWGFAVENTEGRLVRIPAELIASFLWKAAGEVFPEPEAEGLGAFRRSIEALYGREKLRAVAVLFPVEADELNFEELKEGAQ